MTVNYSLYATKDAAEGQLDSNISASDLTIPLKSGEGANFPTTYNGTATSVGDNTTLNVTGIGATGVAVGDFIRNITDGSHAFISAVDTNSVTTTKLQGGSDNTWDNTDEYAVNTFVVTLNKRNATTGVITQSEKVEIKQRSTDTLTAITGGRGFDGDTPASYDADDYVNVFVTSITIKDMVKGIAETAFDIKSLQATAPSALEKIAIGKLLEFDLTYSALNYDVTVAPGTYDSGGSQSSSTPLTLTGSTTNYIEVNQSTGVVSFNTTAFNPSTHLALWTVVTDGTGVTSVVDERQIFGDYPGSSGAVTFTSQTLTAGEDVTQGDILSIQSNNTVEKFVPTPSVYRVQEENQITGGAAHVDIPHIVSLTDTLFVISSTNTSNYHTLQAVSLNRTTGVYTFGTPVQIEASTSTQVGRLLKLSTTRGFMSYKAGATNNPTVRAFSVDPSTLVITFGTAQALSSYGTGGNYYRIFDVDFLDTDKLLCVYNHPSGKYVRVASVSGTVVTLNAEVQLTTDTGQNTIVCAQLDTDKALVGYTDGANLVGRAVTVTGTTVDSLPTAYTLLTGTPTDNYSLRSPFSISGDTDIACFTIATSTSNIRVHQYTVSGTVITADTSGDDISVSTMSNVDANTRGRFIMFDDKNIVFQAGGRGNSSNKRLFQLRYNGTVWDEVGTNLHLSDSFNAASHGTWDSGMDLLSTGEIVMFNVTIDGGYYRDAVMMCIAPTGLPYGLAATTESSASNVDVITHGKATLTNSFTANDIIYAGFGGVQSSTYSEGILIGLMRNVNDVNVNIQQRKVI